MEKDNFRIHIKIDSRTYPLDINREDEEKYRLAAKIVNDTVRRFRGLFRDNDSQDILAMSAFQIALNVAETKKSEDKDLFIEELKNLNDDISDFLKEKKKK
ncbi:MULTISPECIES: cell division protein ZapA [Maribellus]|uniref:Cell division protein ZapA n=1 Tax=Maribellus comscasis TaxID=2681766 RepID=A0A6I6KC93_9BACT|nr:MULTISPECIES: cell division protein ZapA [Maribellus]MCG6188122.1 cell division protein ZapA [Maribellus maritimus]QGY47914.1 cell division protein ZapA [Maribellus comscasis]